MRWTGPEQWHVTLRFLGSVDDVEVAKGRLHDVVAPMALAEMGPASDRFGDRVLHVPVQGLSALAAAVVAASAEIGEPPNDRAFSGHITLARPRGRSKVDLRLLTGTPLAATWAVHEVTLVASTTRPEGAHYEVIERQPTS